MFLAALLGLAFVVAPAEPSRAVEPCATQNAIVCENSKPGSPASEWETASGGSGVVEGFTTNISVNVGDPVNFKIRADGDFGMNIYRMGYYGGAGARRITTLTPDQAVARANQPGDCINNSASTGLVDCGTWGVAATWEVPVDAVSGIYFAHIVRTDTGADGHVMFVVRNDDSHSDLVFQTSDTTWQAYNTWGGNSLYTGEPAGRAHKVSYNRPFNTRGTPDGRDFVWANEYPMVRFLEANGYDLSYQSGIDTDRAGALLLNHKAFLSVGHDEYWSGDQRANVEAARDAGVHLAFFSGNEVYWKTRYEESVDGSGTPYRTLVTYKETIEDEQTDPTGTWTGTWRDPRFSPPTDGGRPENGLTGTITTVISGTRSIKVPAADGKMRFWRSTPVGAQAAGATATLPLGTLGYEWNEDLINGFRPKGLVRLSTANYDVPAKLIDYGSLVAPGNATHHLALYRASSGALVFGAGTVQWSWGLDSHHDGPEAETDVSMQQATVNLLADMDSQPGSLRSGLSPATRSTDVLPAAADITSPAAGASLINGTEITVTGTATDTGGEVGGVEISLDSGQSWHPAEGRETWSYTGRVAGVGSVTIQARATDDSGNVQVTPSQRQVSVACPCVLFNHESPATASTTETTRTELGVRFTPQDDGYITGVTFFKGPANSGTHTGSLWSTTGTRLATGTFTGETESGWQTLQFQTAVPVTAETTYVASYHAPNGGFATTAQYFWGRDAIEHPLAAPRTSASAPNGVYATGASQFPTSSFRGANYWVSPIFDTVIPPDTFSPQAISTFPLSAASSVLLTVQPRITFNEPIVDGSLTLELSSVDGLVAGATTLNAERTVATFTPTAPLRNGTTYTLATAGGTDDAGNVLVGSSSTFRTAEATTPGVCPCTIWSDSDRPATVTVNDARRVELGVKFTAEQSGFVSGIRFFKGGQNVGTHTGTLWSATGAELATATFTDESSSGWQEVRFSSRVPVTAGITYVASYNTAGYYSASAGQLHQDVVNSPLRALASSSSGGNGIYRYGDRAFPTNNANGTSYGVDLVFELPIDILPPAVTSMSPDASADNVLVSAVPSATFSERVVSGLTGSLTAGDETVAATVSLDAAGRTVTVRPSAPLLPGTNYAVSLNGAEDAAGNTMSDAYVWNFTTAGVEACPCTLYPSDRVPAVKSAGDPTPLELGVRIRPTADGFITGVRFYQGEGNTGPHVVSLWTTSGALITAAPLRTETGSGWQVVAFGAPVAVSAGTTYIASYSDPTGHYAADSAQFVTPWVNGPLTGPASASGAGNGVYSTVPGRFPTSSYNATGYGIDVTFMPGTGEDSTPPKPISLSPVDGASSVPTNQAPVATFDEALAPESVQAALTGPGTTPVLADVTIGADSSVSVTPQAALANDTVYTVRINGSDQAGNALLAPVEWSFRTARATTTTCPCSIFTDDSVPAVASDTDQRSVELGVKFSPQVAGVINGLRFYKGVKNDGTHLGTLWSASGTELAKATFTGESATGWQEVQFAAPVEVTAGMSYVASYHADRGGYAYTRDAFASAGVSRGHLSAPMGIPGDPNGVYHYGARGFPSTGTTTNYWVDVLFTPAPPDTTAPAISALAASGTGTTATVTWTTNELSRSVVSFGTDPKRLTRIRAEGRPRTSHSVEITDLRPNTRYHYRVRSRDLADNSTVVPAPSAAPRQYVPATTALIHTTESDFATGNLNGSYLSARDGGEVTLAPVVTEEFGGTEEPRAWRSTSLGAGSSVMVADGSATVSGRLLRTAARYPNARKLDLMATLEPVSGQWVGATDSDFTGPLGQWAAFRTTSSGGLVAETRNGRLAVTSTELPAALLGSARRYAIDWTGSGAVYSVDGRTVATHARGISAAMVIAAKDVTVDSRPLMLDSVWLTPYTRTGTFTSAVVDAGAAVDWRSFTPTAAVPTGTAVRYEVRTGSSATVRGADWSAWTAVAPGADIPGVRRYLQYRAVLGSTAAPHTVAPTLSAVRLAFAIT